MSMISRFFLRLTLGLVVYTQRTTGGRTFQCSSWTAAALDRTRWLLAKRHPGARLLIIQGCYHRGVAASAGTHDEDCCLDVIIVGLSWDDAVLFLRSCGWAAFHRTPAQGFSHHIHMALIPPGLSSNPTPGGVFTAYARLGIRVGIYVPGQIDDYYNRALGLKGLHGYGTDHDPRPAGPVNNYVFHFEEWEREMENLMSSPKTWDDADKEVVVGLIAAGVRQTMGSLLGKVVPVGRTRTMESIPTALQRLRDDANQIQAQTSKTDPK